MNITVIINTYNEEKNIAKAIASAKQLTDTIIVVDTESTDSTATKAESEGAVVKKFPYSRYVEPAREYGIQQAKTEWIFILDADERISPTLASEIKRAITQSSHTSFSVPRKNIFGNKWLQYGGWWPDRQTRLIKKSALKEWPKHIHSTPKIEGSKGELKEALEHYFHGNIEGMVQKTITFEDIESDLLFQAKRPVNVATFFRKYFGELYRRLIKNLGFLDGSIGIIESVYQAYSKTITYLYLYEKKKSSSV